MNIKTMNKYEKQLPENIQKKKCPQCGFKNNLSTIYCQNCEYRLVPVYKPSQNFLTIPWSIVPLFLLLLLSGGLILVWRKNAVSLKQASIENFIVTSRPQELTFQNTKADSDSYLKFYNSMEDVRNVPQGVFFYGGAIASAGLRSNSIVNEMAKAQPQFHLSYIDPLNSPPDSEMGIKMVIDGQLSFSQSFRPLKQYEYDLANSRGFKLRQVPVAISGIAFYTNLNIKVPGISLAQVEKIYTGKLTNWQQLGGPDLPIIPVSQTPDAKASSSFLLQGMLEGSKRFGPNVQVVRNTTSAIRKVASTPGAIGYGAQPLVVGQRTIRLIGLSKGNSTRYVQPMTAFGAVNKQALLDGSYPLIRRIFIIFREDGHLDELAGKAYVDLLLSTEGQRLIEEVGYLPIRIIENISF
ncbi:MAG: substrate-binding domain-containing protein [Xenococcaceae cyanobacterium MO_188.B29]|nr:substrate-binding domain-containing protein [Xenococcaceae cyanobacterium MO_188.B29]